MVQKIKAGHGGHRDWDVFCRGQRVGDIHLQYPIGTHKPFLTLRTDAHGDLPIRVYGTIFSGGWEVIPENAPPIADPDIERLLFLVNVFFRMRVVGG